MRKISFAFAIIFFILFSISCSSLVQLYEVKFSTPMKIESNSYTYENDTIKIIYSFWADHGTLSYTVFNKLEIPLYIDWKKSSYVWNSEKIDYWENKTTIKSSGTINGNFASGNRYGSYYSSSYNSSSLVKQEQIVFIAPKSAITKEQFIILPFSKNKFSGFEKFSDENRTDNPKKTTQIRYAEFSSLNSPLIFRNFLTISTSDKFDKEIYIDNGFYISKISEMDKPNFWGGSLQAEYTYPFKSPSNFFIEFK